MAVNLNLLPQDLAIGRNYSKIIKVIRAVNIILLTFFLISLIGIGIFYSINSLRLSSLVSQNKNLISKIKAEETTEQKLILLKDRIAKVKLAYSSDSLTKSIDLVSPIISQLPDTALINELNLDMNKITASFLFRSGGDVSTFFQNIYSSNLFKGVNLTSFGFSPKTGYLVSLELVAK